jgi:hypothetical protein
MSNTLFVEGSPIWNICYQATVRYFLSGRSLSEHEVVLPPEAGESAQIVNSVKAFTLLTNYLSLLQQHTVPHVFIESLTETGVLTNSVFITAVLDALHIQTPTQLHVIPSPASARNVLETLGWARLKNNTILSTVIPVSVELQHFLGPFTNVTSIVCNGNSPWKDWLHGAAAARLTPSSSEPGAKQRKTTAVDEAEVRALLHDSRLIAMTSVPVAGTPSYHRPSRMASFFGGTVLSFMDEEPALVPILVDIRDRARAAAAFAPGGRHTKSANRKVRKRSASSKNRRRGSSTKKRK